jgi:transcriptional regulator with XRE-family HTH domain
MSRQMVSRTPQTGQDLTTLDGLGLSLRALREKGKLPLWKVAHAAEMDSTLLSKIERGQRLPTQEQTAALAKFFSVDVMEFESMRMAEKFLSDNGHNPAAAALAVTRIRESAGEYFVKRKRATASKQRKL